MLSLWLLLSSACSPILLSMHHGFSSLRSKPPPHRVSSLVTNTCCRRRSDHSLEDRHQDPSVQFQIQILTLPLILSNQNHLQNLHHCLHLHLKNKLAFVIGTAINCKLINSAKSLEVLTTSMTNKQTNGNYLDPLLLWFLIVWFSFCRL